MTLIEQDFNRDDTTRGGARVINLEQRSPEWFTWRQHKATASNACVIMGAAPDWSNIQLWDDLRLDEAGLGPERSYFLQKALSHGTKLEPIALQRIDPDAHPACVECMGDPLYTASLDGWVEDHYWLEIKCPSVGAKSKVLRALQATSDPDARIHVLSSEFRHYWWQLVHQAGVLNDPELSAKFAVFVDGGCFEVVEVPAERLLADWPALKRQWERYLAGEAQRAPSRPIEWNSAALDYTEARTRYKAAQAALERTAEATALNTASQALAGAREALLAAGVGESESVKVEMKKSGGNVSWKDCATALAQDANINLAGYSDDYRTKTSESLTIKEL